MFVHVNLYDIKHRFATHLITAMKYKNIKKSDQTGISCPCFYGDVALVDLAGFVYQF
jgi:hypothetical protein